MPGLVWHKRAKGIKSKIHQEYSVQVSGLKDWVAEFNRKVYQSDNLIDSERQTFKAS